MNDYDIIIVGAGAGGGTLARKLAPSGLRILILERGDFLPPEDDNWSSDAIITESKYQTDERWERATADGSDDGTFRPEAYYRVGGNTKCYGAVLQRMRERDFEELHYPDGTSPAWDLKYEAFEPHYAEAERWYMIHGQEDEDPSEPPRPGGYPFPPFEHEPRIGEVAEQLKAKGLHPFHAPLALNRDTSAAIGEGGDRPCIRCQTCDPYPCKLHAKQDAEIAAVRPALEHANVELAIGAKVRRLVASDDGRRVEAVEVEMDGATQRLTADRVVLSCGAVNSAVIMHSSKCDAWPNGAGNSNDLVGRFLTKHNHSALLSIDTSKPNDTVFQKTLGFNDYYFGSPDHDYPLGAVQLTGKAPWQRLAHFANAKEGTMPRAMLEFLAGHSIDWWVTSEDLPDRNNRVQAAADGRPRVTYTPNNRGPHRELLKLWQDHLRDIGFEMFWIQTMGLPVVWHQAGTCVFGADPATSVLDLNCRSHEVENLYVVDSSFMPSMGSVNLTLTICANAIRVGDHMLG